MGNRYWNSTGSTDLNDGSNYTGSGTLLSTDDIIFDSTSVVNATATNHLHVNSILVSSNYSGNMSFSGYDSTYESGYNFSGSNSINGGNKIIAKGNSGVCYFASNLTTNTTELRFDGTVGMSFTIYNIVPHYKKMTFGPNAVVTINSNQAWGLNYGVGADYPIEFENGGHLTNNHGPHIYLSAPGPFLKLNGDVITDGAGGYNWTVYNVNGITATIPALNSGPCALNIDAATNCTIKLTGKLNINGTFYCYPSNTNNTFDLDGYDMTCGEFWGGNYEGGSTVLRYGEGGVSFSNYKNHMYNDGHTDEYYESAHFFCAGNWITGTNHTIHPGTSTVALTGSGAIGNGVFHNLIISGSYTLGTDATCDSYQLISGGSLNLNGFKLVINAPPVLSLIYGDG
jgi:hypothetical protein